MKEKGIIISLTLVFGTIFLLLMAGLLEFILLQNRQSLRKAAWENSLQIAEAGTNYYWYVLNHTPENQNPDIQDGNNWCCKVGGVEYGQDDPQCQHSGFTICGDCDGSPCYKHTYIDPETNATSGVFSLEIKAKKICGKILGVYLYSTGQTEDFPSIKRKVQVKFATTPIAEYSYVVNSSVWAGADRTIYGKYHSNGGIRMDATHNSLVTSAQSSWLCTSAFGCYSNNCPSGCQREGNACRCPGVFGSGGPSDYWKFPVTPFDFSGLTADLSQMKTLAQEKGKYYPPSTDYNPDGKGYHIIFHPDGTYTINIVTETKSVYACDKNGDGVCSGGNDWYWSPEKISSEYTLEDGSTPSGCGLIFAEDNLWVEGTVKGKKTVASANLIDPNTDTTAFLPNNIDYTTTTGADSLALIVEKDILIPCDSPDNMTLRGVFIAQKGQYGRRFYIDPGTYWWYCWWYPERCCSQAKRSYLFTSGSIISNGRTGTRWGDSSGYQKRDDYFDDKLAKDPPPLLPYVSPEMGIISWEEIK